MKSSSAVLALLGVAMFATARAIPIRYDQRQDGDWNMDARLQNFFVVLSPSNTAALEASGISLLDFASKAVPIRRPATPSVVEADSIEDQSRLPAKQRQEPVGLDDGKEVVVAVGRSADDYFPQPVIVSANSVPPVFTKDDIVKSPLAKLHPELQVAKVLIAHSPIVALKYPVRAAQVPAMAAVPMLVAVPVPEVAPNGPAPVGGAAAILGVHRQPLEEMAAPAPAPSLPLPEMEQAPPKAEFIPAAVISLPATHVIPAPILQAQQSVETNQVINLDAPKKEEASALAVAPVPQEPENDKPTRLIGTGIEDCGPARHRNTEGVCVDDRD